MHAVFGTIVFVAALIMTGLHGAKAEDGYKFRAITVDGRERSYDAFIPSAQEGVADPVPLVIMLHGGGGNADNAKMMSGFSDLAAKEGFIVAYPNGSGRRDDKILTWNAEHCCAYAMKNNIDDVAFISALIDEMVANDNVDPTRVYVTGMSNGAMMTLRLARELPDKIAAIAPVVGGMFGGEAKPLGPVAVMTINGSLDKSVPVKGGQTGNRFQGAWDGTPLEPSTYMGTYWVAANGCARAVKEGVEGDYIQYRRFICPKGQEVVQYIIRDNGHAWPGGERGKDRADGPSKHFDATREMWEFFMSHRKDMPQDTSATSAKE